MFIGAVEADPGGITDAGESYVVFKPTLDTAEISDLSGLLSSIGPDQTLFRNIHLTEISDRVLLSLTSQQAIVIETANDGTAENHDTVVEISRIDGTFITVSVFTLITSDAITRGSINR